MASMTGYLEFQSTLPAWGETLCHWDADTMIAISIHSPRVGRDEWRLDKEAVFQFQSTLPAWGETAGRTIWYGIKQFQSTLPAWGETYTVLCARDFLQHFNPLSPRGERRNLVGGRRMKRFISIHSPRVGRDRV